MSTPDDVLTAVRATVKYSQVSDVLIRRIAAQELTRRRTLKEAIEATRNKLHQVAGLYQEPKMRYGPWLAELRAAGSDRAAQLTICRKLMRHHTSTREREPSIDAFYAAIFAGLPPVHSVLDIACGLNPLYAPWMPLAAGAAYHALDVYADMLAFVGATLGDLHVAAQPMLRDVLDDGPLPAVDLALVLKTVPCLEQVDPDAGVRLLDKIHARTIVVSFPTRSVGGKNVGMAAHYAQRFATLAAGRAWDVETLMFDNELVYRVSTRP
jgi:16S rRNA (guanine(1405)-N(7))-methyltransferase